MQTSEIADKDFPYAYLPEFLDGELAAADFARLEKAAGGTKAVKEMAENFQTIRGKLQLALQSYYLREDELVKLHRFIRDPETQQTMEAAKIEAVERSELFGTMRRRVLLTVLGAAAIFGIVYFLTPQGPKKFDALEYLGYESLAMDEDPEGRLDLPSNDMKEITQYLHSYPNLEFQPYVLKSLSQGWEPAGATVIDYEVAKVAVVKFTNPELKDTLYHFSFSGSLKDLPKAPVGKEKGFEYQTYASDTLNIVAWQAEGGVVCFLVGRRSAPELATIARVGAGV